MWYTVVLIALIFFWVSLVLGLRLGLVDKPDARKQHRGDVPLTGGIAIFGTIVFSSLVLSIPPYTQQILIIATGVFALGLYDDRSRLNAALRLLIQYGSGVLLATYGGIVIVNAGNLLAMGDIPLLILAVPLTALSVAGLCNAYNMIDGIDGLAASMIALPLLLLYLLAASASHPMADSLLLILIPVVVFLGFNLGPNNRLLPKIFLGDAGSVTLGFLLTASLVYFSQGEAALILPVTALWLVTVPLMDMLATMLLRWKNGQNMMQADRSHLHHTLMARGLSSRQTLVLLIAYASACALLGLALENLAESLSLLIYFLLFVGHCLFVIKSRRSGSATGVGGQEKAEA